MTGDLLATLGRIVDGGGDADDVLRAAVSRLAQEPGIAWAGIRFVEGDELVLGPSAGSVDEEQALATPIVYREAPVGELVVHGAADGAVLARVADLVAPFVLLGWDTGGEAWVP
jgi:putative methionine-R-sulfoxide reductase with GAF domain